MKGLLGSVAVGALLLGAAVMPASATTCNGICTPINQSAIDAAFESIFGDSTTAANIVDDFAFTVPAPPPATFASSTDEITVHGVTLGALTIALKDSGGNVIPGGTVVVGTDGAGDQTIDLINVPVTASEQVYIEITGTCSGKCSFSGTETLSATPLPAALPLFATGMGLLGFFGRRRKKTAVLA